MRTIRGKMALVTGAASGIGRAIALRLAREGADLYLLDVDEAGLADVVASAKRCGIEAISRRCDVSRTTEITNSVTHIVDRWGGVDILVNNAGITYYGKTDQMTAEHCDRLLTINLHAPIQLTRELLPTLLARPEAHVLNVASFLGLIGTPKLAVYSASKFGLIGFTESLRAEYGRRGLGATALCPGFVETNLFAAAPHGADRQEEKQPPSWTRTTPERIAEHAIRAIYRNRALVIPQHYAKLAYCGKRFFPGLIDWAYQFSRHRKKRGAVSVDTSRRDARRQAA